MSPEALAPDQIIMRPFGRKAWRFISRSPAQDRKYTIAEGSVRSSKTFMADAKIITQYSQYEVPGKRFIAGVSKETVHRNMLIDLFSIVGQENYSYNMSTGELWIFGKQYFVVGARDEASYKKILGATIGLFIGDEIVEFPKSFLAQVWMRMSPDGARFLGTTNPGNPYAYLKAEVIDEFSPEKLEIIHFTLDDNPNISPEAKRDIIASQTGVFKLRYIDGLWVVAEGSIYRDSWDEQANQFDGVVKAHGKEVPLDPEPIGLRAQGGHVDHWFSIDAGVDHPQVHLEYYDDGDVIWVTREQVWDSKIERKQKTDGQYSEMLQEFGALGHEVRIPPEAASLRNQLLLDGFWVVDADNAVSEGIHTVSTLLARRKLRISKTGCPRTSKRIPTYAWNDKSALRGVEEPLKKEDDEPDSLRYGVHGKIPIWRVTQDA
jgi:PBSX family phage terminase large subunit